MPAQKSIDSEKLRAKLKLRHFATERKIRQSHPAAAQFYDKHRVSPGGIRRHASALLASSALAGTLLLGAPTTANVIKNPAGQNQTVSSVLPPGEQRRILGETIRSILPPVGSWHLTSGQENRISDVLNSVFGIKAVAELDGNHLNTNFGRMGAEQHLPRFPGDSVSDHGNLVDKGLTPGLGAWGYFASSKSELTPELVDTEKYYVAVQTLYLPDWATRQPYLKDWYKYRRVVVVNPANGKTIVCSIADSGPSDFTGKQFGGSPEVMDYLGINYGMQDHPVVLMFLDDPEKKVPLGPLENNVKLTEMITSDKS